MNATIVTLFATYTQAERAVYRLKSFNLTYSLMLQRRVWHTILHKLDHQPTAETLLPGMIRRARMDSLMGLLVGVGSRGMSNLGRMMVAGPLAQWLDEQEQNVQQDLLRILLALDIPQERALAYEKGVRAEGVLLMVHFSPPEGQEEKARVVLSTAGGQLLTVLRDLAVPLYAQ